MRKWIGVICVFLGVACIISSIGLVVYNQLEDKKAEGVSQTLLKDVQNILDEKTPENIDKEMPTVKVGNYDCIGILSVPVLELELPVLTDWSYAKLKKAPCHYYGT